MDDLNWDEKDLNDFITPKMYDEQENYQIKRKSYSKQLSQITYGNDYPFDIWFRIGTYIAPEDIGRFALICQTTNRVINSVAFWISIFKKYNKNEIKQFSRLLSKEHFSIVRIHVIKLLYKNYSLFQNRIKNLNKIQIDPHILVSSRCIRIWYSERITQPISYNYYFEFNFHPSQSTNPIQVLSPLFNEHTRYMLDKDSYILHLISSKYLSFDHYMGMILSKLTYNIGNDYRYYKLHMYFNSSRVSKSNNNVLRIDPVLRLRIYRWYNIPSNFD